MEARHLDSQLSTLIMVPGGAFTLSEVEWADGIPLFAKQLCSQDGLRQAMHYDNVAKSYLTNLQYKHTIAYMNYLDRSLCAAIGPAPLGIAAEICCGHGEALKLLGEQLSFGIGIDVSLSMLKSARQNFSRSKFSFIQGDATMLPLKNESLDTVFMFGGIHHVNDRAKLFSEIHRVLRPGGRFIFREPVSDFILWRALRTLVYRLSPALDHQTERPLRRCETEPFLIEAGLKLNFWRTYGFLGFCLFMNSDILVVNRGFRFIPGITAIVNAFTWLDEKIIRWPGMSSLGLQVIAIAQKEK